MTTKSLLLAGTLALAGLAFAHTRTYSITLDTPARAGNVQLAAGSYKVKLEGNNAVFTDSDTSKSYSAPVKIENVPKKFGYTSVETRQRNGTAQIDAIELGGTTTKLEFGE